jgi:hypothetical protein
MWMNAYKDWVAVGTAVTAALAWLLSNGLDVLSVLVALQSGERFAFVRFHTVEFFVIYADMRMLGTIAVLLIALSASERWPSASRITWAALTMCALVTALAAWWRL